jgi:hypothetical protein
MSLLISLFGGEQAYGPANFGLSPTRFPSALHAWKPVPHQKARLIMFACDLVFFCFFPSPRREGFGCPMEEGRYAVWPLGAREALTVVDSKG